VSLHKRNTRTMKVGIVHTAYLQKGGEDIVVEQEYQLLQRNNIPVSILYFKNASGMMAQVKSYLGSAFNMRSYRTISKWIADEKPDVIHVHNWHYEASPSVFRAAKHKGVPVVHTLHNYRLLCPSGTLIRNNQLFLNSINAGFPWSAVKHRVYRNSYIQTFLLAFTVWLHKVGGTWANINKFIVLTDNAKEVFKASKFRFTEEQIAVKPNFIPYIPSAGAEEKRGTHFLFVGRLSEEKGIQILLDAFANSEYSLRIIGTGPMQERVNEYAGRYTNIQYLGFQNQQYILNELKRCTAFIFPSIWYEGNPLTIIESLACGTPVIASGIGAMKSMITDQYNGLHMQPGSVSDLQCKLNIWHNTPIENRRSFYENARITYEKMYTPERNLDQLLSIYKSLKNE
jgi:glycosyltransferase involved in cell wall biosynthesis